MHVWLSVEPVSSSGVETAEADSGRGRGGGREDWSIPLATAERGRRGTGGGEERMKRGRERGCVHKEKWK